MASMFRGIGFKWIPSWGQWQLSHASPTSRTLEESRAVARERGMRYAGERLEHRWYAVPEEKWDEEGWNGQAPKVTDYHLTDQEARELLFCGDMEGVERLADREGWIPLMRAGGHG